MATSARALGSPPITTPASVSLPVVQQLANNIRERIQRIEARLPQGAVQESSSPTAAQASSSSSSASLQRQISSLRADVDRLLAAAGGADGDQLMLLIPDAPAPEQPCNDVSAVLAARVFGA